MFSALVDERGDFAAFEVVEAAADQRKAVAREVFDRGRKIELAVEPRFNGVLIGGGHIHQVAGFERAHVVSEDFRRELLVAVRSVQAGQQLPGRDDAQCQDCKRPSPP